MIRIRIDPLCRGVIMPVSMQVPLLDLREQFPPLRDEILARIADLADRQDFVLGPAVESCEAALAQYCGVPHAIGVSSGTDAILVALMALGIGPGDAVVTSPYSFFATAGCIARLGAEPVFCDIDPVTFNLDPHRLKDLFENRLRRSAADGSLQTPAGHRVRAILPVHLFGLCCDLEPIARIACEHGLPLIEDAAQAIGAEYRNRDGTAFCAGAYGVAGCFSFYPTKNLGGFGDGGLVTCTEPALDRTFRALRNHGMEDRYFHRMIGGNFRLDAIQAAVIEIKLRHLDGWSAARRTHAARYRALFAEHGLTDRIALPSEPWADRALTNHHIYNQFVIRVPERDRVQNFLREHGVGTAIYYPLPLHLQECFAHLGHAAGSFPEAERAARETLALPIYPELRADQLDYVVETLTKALRQIA